MKILHICPHFYPCMGGIEKHVGDLCKNLIKLGHESDVICLNTCAYSKKKLPKFEIHERIKIHRISSLNFKLYKFAPSVAKYIKDYNIIHIHGIGFFTDFLVLTKFLHKKKLILSTHGGIFHTKDYILLKKFYFYCLEKFILKGIDKIIACSKNDYKLFSKINSNIKLIKNGIDCGHFSKVKRKPKKNTFIYIGRISENKRIDNLIKTFYFIKKKANFKLFVIGKDWQGLRNDLEKLVKEKKIEKNIIFTGKVDNQNLLKYLSKAEFFVSASEYEGFGISVLEAMAMGLVPVVNKIEAFRNFIENDKNGFLIDYSKPKKASESILNIISDKNLLKISKNAQKTAKEYDWKMVIKKIIKLYEDVIK